MSSTSAQSASRRRTGPVFWAASGWDRRALDRWVESGRGPQVVSATQPAVPYDQHLTRVQEIDTWPDGPRLREFVSRYARLLIPAAESTAGLTWGVSPLANNGRTAFRINVGKVEVAWAVGGRDGLGEVALNLARVGDEETMRALLTRGGHVRSEDIEMPAPYRTLHGDIVRVWCPNIDAAFALLSDPAVMRAARLLNSRLVLTGSPHRRGHAPALLDELVAAGRGDRVPGSPPPDRGPATLVDAPGKPAEIEGVLCPLATGEPPRPVDDIELRAYDAEKQHDGHARHEEACSKLKEVIEARGDELSGIRPRVIEGHPDGVWVVGGVRDGAPIVVIEVKSTTPENVVGQIRLGIGQVLDYRFALRSLLSSSHRVIEAMLVVTGQRLDDRWYDVCDDAGVWLAEEHNLTQVVDTIAEKLLRPAHGGGAAAALSRSTRAPLPTRTP